MLGLTWYLHEIHDREPLVSELDCRKLTARPEIPAHFHFASITLGSNQAGPQ